MKTFILTVMVSALIPGAADAAVTLRFTGTTTASGISGTGTQFSAEYTFDETTPLYSTYKSNSSPVSTNATYLNPGKSFEFSSGSFSLSSNKPSSNSNYITLTDHTGGNDIFSISVGSASSTININLIGSTNTISSIALIDPSTKGWTVQKSISVSDGRGNLYKGAITSMSIVTSAVPEPATWAMMLLGFGMIGAAARYRRRSTILATA